MAIDRGKLPRVAWLLAVVALEACGPSVRPDMPFPEEKLAKPKGQPIPDKLARQVVVGELCPQAAAGRPAVAPLLMHTTQWIDTANEVTDTVERGSAPRFAVYGTDGKIAGVFDTLGMADITLGQSVATGTYAGGVPCSAEAAQAQRTDDPACLAATHGCGLAVATLARPDDPPATPALAIGGACVSPDGRALAVDVDGDGVVEWFALAQILDGIRGPVQEWPADQNARPSCAPAFVAYNIKLAPEPEPGKPVDARAVVTLDLLGVLDLDGDGRKELVIALRFPTVRTIVVYSAVSSPRRLELVGEAQSFQN